MEHAVISVAVQRIRLPGSMRVTSWLVSRTVNGDSRFPESTLEDLDNDTLEVTLVDRGLIRVEDVTVAITSGEQ